MTNQILRRLFDGARKSSVPVPRDGFEERVIGALRRDSRRETNFLLDQLNQLFPHWSAAAALLICLCATAVLVVTVTPGLDFPEGMAQLSEQWIFPETEF